MPSLNDFLMNKTAGSANLSFGWYPLHLAFPNSEYANRRSYPSWTMKQDDTKLPLAS